MTTLNKKVLTELVNAACEGKTLTMAELKSSLLPGQRNLHGMMLAKAISEVYTWCAEKNWPRLPSLVVRASGQDQGIPAPGFWKELDKSHPYYNLWSGTKLIAAPISIKRLITQFEHQICFNYFGGLEPNLSAIEYTDPSAGPSRSESYYNSGLERIYQEIPELRIYETPSPKSELDTLWYLSRTWVEDEVDKFIDLFKHTTFPEGAQTFRKAHVILQFMYAKAPDGEQDLGSIYNPEIVKAVSILDTLEAFTKLDSTVQLTIVLALARKLNVEGACNNFVSDVLNRGDGDRIFAIARSHGADV